MGLGKIVRNYFRGLNSPRYRSDYSEQEARKSSNVAYAPIELLEAGWKAMEEERVQKKGLESIEPNP